MEGLKQESASIVARVAHAVDLSSVSTCCLQDDPMSACMLTDPRRMLSNAGGCSESGGVDSEQKIGADKCYVIERKPAWRRPHRTGKAAALSDNSEDDEDFTYGNDLEIELRAALFSASGHSQAPSSGNGLKNACISAPAEDEKVNELDDYDQLIRDATRLKKEHDAGEFITKGVPRVVQRHETQEDFIRSFLMDEKMHKTLRTFQTEWYELRLGKAGMSSDDVATGESAEIPSALLANQQLKGRITFLEQEVMKQRETATKALCWFDQFKKERDFHRMHHRRLKHENDKHIQELKQLNKNLAEMSTESVSLQQKIRAGIRECTLVKMERDKLAAHIKLLKQHSLGAPPDCVATEPAAGRLKLHSNRVPATAPSQEGETLKEIIQHGDSEKVPTKGCESRDTPWRAHRGMHVSPKHVQCEGEGQADAAAAGPDVGVEEGQCVRTNWAANADSVSCFNALEAHDASVVSLATHSRIDLMATTSDDGTWKIWQMPRGHLIMAGSGHKDWVSSAAFHPTASVLVTASGDGTAKLWSISREMCTHTFSDHTKPLWDCCFHDTGDFFATCSMDHTIRCFDANSLRCRQILRAHTDSVNAICFQPYTNCLASVSSDKMVNFWDARTGTLVRKFAGHHHSCNDVSFTHQGTIISCDSGGALHMWDLRKMSQLLEINCGPAAAHSCAADINGEIIAVSSSDRTIKLLSIKKNSLITNLEGHTDHVLDVQFSKDCTYLCSAGADGKVRLWQ